MHYTCFGEVRGECGTKHRSVATAARCCRKDMYGCNRQGGYSDRFPERRDDDNVPYPLNEWEREEANAIIK